MSISLIWAMGANHVIGKDNDMPWHLPLDFAYFKAETLGKRMLMGSQNMGFARRQALEGQNEPNSN